MQLTNTSGYNTADLEALLVFLRDASLYGEREIKGRTIMVKGYKPTCENPVDVSTVGDFLTIKLISPDRDLSGLEQLAMVDGEPEMDDDVLRILMRNFSSWYTADRAEIFDKFKKEGRRVRYCWSEDYSADGLKIAKAEQLMAQALAKRAGMNRNKKKQEQFKRQALENAAERDKNIAAIDERVTKQNKLIDRYKSQLKKLRGE